jgi:hypothetical protein
MIAQIVDSLGQQRDLNFRRTGVTLVRFVLRNDTLASFSRNHHSLPDTKSPAVAG